MKSFKYFIIALWSIIFGSNARAQENLPLSLGIGLGYMNGSHYPNAKANLCYQFNLAYHFTQKHSLAMGYLKGGHRYFDDVHSNNAVPLSTPGYENNRNAEADYFITSVQYQYRVVGSKNFSFIAGTGLAIITQVVNFPYSTQTPSGFSVDFRESTVTGLAFPLSLAAEYHLSDQIKLGLFGGVFIEPDYPLIAEHLGIKAGFSFR